MDASTRFSIFGEEKSEALVNLQHFTDTLPTSANANAAASFLKISNLIPAWKTGRLPAIDYFFTYPLFIWARGQSN